MMCDMPNVGVNIRHIDRLKGHVLGDINMILSMIITNDLFSPSDHDILLHVEHGALRDDTSMTSTIFWDY